MDIPSVLVFFTLVLMLSVCALTWHCYLWVHCLTVYRDCRFDGTPYSWRRHYAKFLLTALAGPIAAFAVGQYLPSAEAIAAYATPTVLMLTVVPIGLGVIFQVTVSYFERPAL